MCGFTHADRWPYEAYSLYPSCLHAILASTAPNQSSHTVPHSPLQYTSSRPWLEYVPPVRRISPDEGEDHSLVESEK